MNAALPDSHPSIQYYDSDYPSRELSRFAENFDAVTELQGLAHDVERYIALARDCETPVIELCCGSGRVGIPLARAGARVMAVDISEGMLQLFRDRLASEDPDVSGRITLVRQDISALHLSHGDYALAIAPFNSLLCLTSFEQQRAAVQAAARHLRPGGRLVLDLMNPLVLPLAGDAVPKPFFTRRNAHTGNRYTRFAAMGPMAASQVQRLWGWYDEVFADGTVHRTEYSMEWRLIFRYELELMLTGAGLELESVEGGHQGEPFTATSRKMFAIARKPRTPERRA